MEIEKNCTKYCEHCGDCLDCYADMFCPMLTLKTTHGSMINEIRATGNSDKVRECQFMSKDFDLLPCPFCGGKAHFEELPSYGWKVFCGSGLCLVKPIMEFHHNQQGAAENWNTRKTLENVSLSRPSNCACEYPKIVCKSFSGHDINCPVEIELLSRHTTTAGFVTVNGKVIEYAMPEISYETVIEFAGFKKYLGRATTITYRKGVDEKPEGILIQGESVPFKSGMIFSVATTSNG